MKHFFFSLLMLFCLNLHGQNTCDPDTIPPEFGVTSFSVNILPTGMITLWATDFLDNLYWPSDNCTNSNLLTVEIKREFPEQGCPPFIQGSWGTHVTFDACSLGPQKIYVRVIDLSGNVKVLETFVIIQDNFSNITSCDMEYGDICAFTPDGSFVTGVSWEAWLFTPWGIPPFQYIGLDTACFKRIPMSVNYEAFTTKVLAESNANPTNGLSTYDLVLISKHLLGIDTLSAPYNQIAADVNISNSITTYDIVLARKMILGLIDTFPHGKSWRFIPESYMFPDSTNPFVEPIPDTLIIGFEMDKSCYHFTGVKIGDVNNSAIPLIQQSLDDRNAISLLFPHKFAEKGSEITIPISIDLSGDLEGIQFALNYAEQLNIDYIHSDLPGFDLSSHVNHKNDSREIVVSWNGFDDFSPGIDQAVLYIHGRVNEPVNTRDLISLSTSFSSECYSNGLQTNPLELQSYLKNNNRVRVWPNPANDRVQIRWSNAPDDSRALLQIFDLHGRLVQEFEKNCVGNQTTFSIPGEVIHRYKGQWLTYHLTSGGRSVTGKFFCAN